MGSFTENKFIMMGDVKDENGSLYLFKQAKKFISVVFSNKYKILLFTSLIVALGIFTAPKKKYAAETTLFFNVSKDSKFLSLVNRFSGGGSQDISFDKFQIVTFSNDLLDKIIQKQVEIDGEKKKLIEFIIKHEKIDKNWDKKPELYEIDFGKKSFKRDSIQKTVIKLLKRKINVAEDKNGLIRLSFTSTNEQLAYLFNTLHYQEVESFFDDMQLKQDVKSLEILSIKRDSVFNEITATEDFLASRMDYSHNTVKQKGMVEIQRKERQLRILTQIYIELVKQYELINYRVLDKKNLLVKLDSPILPLEKFGRSLLITVFVYGFVGIVFSSLFVYFFFYIKELNQLSNN